MLTLVIITWGGLINVPQAIIVPNLPAAVCYTHARAEATRAHVKHADCVAAVR